jgi:uncharacterized iron-regulated membrane protein
VRHRGRVRRVLFEVHLWGGVALSLYILIICVSGSAIVFRRELDKTLCPTTLTVPVGPRRLTLQELKSKAHAAYPRFGLKQISVRDALTPGAPVEILFSGGGQRLERLFDPYSGADLGDTITCEPRSISALASFHDNLSSGPTGRVVNGVGALAITLLCLSGAIVWWPGKQHLGRAMTIRSHVPWPRLVRDLHSALGFWLILLVLLWAVTGIYFAFPDPFNALADTLVNAGLPSRAVDDAIEWIVRLHFGRSFGHGVEVLWVTLGLLPTALVISGLIMWAHRVLSPARPVQAQAGRPEG